MVKGNATVGLNEVNYSRGGCIFWSETSNQGLQVACQGKPRELLLTVLIPDHLHSPGDGGNPVTSACVAFRQSDEKKELLRNGLHWAAQGQGLHRDESVSSFSPIRARGGCSCRLFALFHQRCGAVGNTDLSQLLYQLRAR